MGRSSKSATSTGRLKPYPTAAIVEAITAARGRLTLAADALGCTWNCIRKRADQEPAIMEAIRSARESRIDVAESVIDEVMTQMKQVRPDLALNAATFVLKTVGKDRGYAERSEITGKDGAPIQTEDVSLSDEQRAARLAALLDKAGARRARRAAGDGRRAKKATADDPA